MSHFLTAIVLMAGCSQEQPVEPQEARTFHLLYQSAFSGEVEPCG